ncbi:hypothetical protein C8F04DRAFT_1180215 [Mycena alexandri]|uniref:Uncharacterized protein n=1 Tax=Mycena alexandri TaxID=1745969 RepID=A0AAD6X3L7_9AGAR|nr:hypothetical protein C8F04DRAFT_1180215 [Mycena alexandri]
MKHVGHNADKNLAMFGISMQHNLISEAFLEPCNTTFWATFHHLLSPKWISSSGWRYGSKYLLHAKAPVLTTLAKGKDKPKEDKQPGKKASITTMKPRAKAKKPGGRKKAATVTEPKSKSGPTLSPNLKVAADATEAQWHAQLDLAVAAQKILMLQTQADMFIACMALMAPLLTQLQLHNLQLETELKAQRILGKNQSLWLMGTPLRLPLNLNATAAAPTTGAAGNETMEALARAANVTAEDDDLQGDTAGDAQDLDGPTGCITINRREETKEEIKEFSTRKGNTGGPWSFPLSSFAQDMDVSKYVVDWSKDIE